MDPANSRPSPLRAVSVSAQASDPFVEAWSKRAVHLANQPARPDHDENHEEEELPSSADRPDEIDEVDEASRESFPASDPPAFTPLHIGT